MAEKWHPISISELEGYSLEDKQRIIDSNFYTLSRFLNDIRDWIDNAKIANGAITLPKIATLPSLLGWQQDMTFSATDYNTVAWTSGTITLSDGTTYSIVSGNTGDITALTYIYLDTGTSSTVLQTTTAASSAVGSGKLLMGTANVNADTAKDASFQIFGGAGGMHPLVDTAQILADAVTEREIADAAIINAKIANATIDLAAKVQGLLPDANLAQITDPAKLADAIVSAAKIATGAVEEDKIAASAVTTAKIAASAVEEAKLATGAVTEGKIAALAITAVKLAASAIIAEKIATGAVTTEKLDALAVTAEKIAAGTITGSKIAASTITGTLIAADTIAAANIAAGAIGTGELDALAVTAAKIAAGAIETDKIAANAVTATKIAAATITAVEIAAGTITANEIAVGTILAANIVANTITANEIATNAITTSKILAANVTGPKMTDIWRKIYDNELTSSATSFTISGLDGNTDYEYSFEFKVVCGVSSSFRVRLNNSSSGYRRQRLYHETSTVSAIRTGDTGFWIGQGNAAGKLSHSSWKLFVKSGTVRTMIGIGMYHDSVTTSEPGKSTLQCQIWNDTSTNITSLVLVASAANGFGAGTRLLVYKRV